MSSDEAKTGAIVGVSVGASIIVLLVIIAVIRAYKQRNSAGAKASRTDVKKWYRAVLEKIVAARVEKESSTEFGEPVFLSHYIDRGQFRHWVLHAHGYKYELRQTRTQTQGEAEDSHSRRYAAAIAPSGFDLEAYKQSIVTRYSPVVGYYFYSMIGWTTLSKEQVDEECGRVSANFERYNALGNNCHDFLQQLADEIVTTKAPDWDWFRRASLSLGGTYNYISKWPALTHQVISAAQHFERLKHYLGTTERQEVENFIVTLRDFIDAQLNQVFMTSLAALSVVTANNANNGNHDGGAGCGGGGC
ncbi:hypothetical protein CNMCM5793_001416 [Aspergillus hiratsukae]|uniref:Uncharacterized protein n=1 Tax=Aspergillus hiratsukae TaxID=1194566 RepID=A0A8H6URY7_9EURO|nr:hypothetical protein CNMCM5793_001416 [Aspergillus hiratsukae]KAF7164637.1 hypothetical protein CNMCM6106_001089 [Aspergillus hiratsukae]